MAVTSTNFKIRSIIYNSGLSSPSSSVFNLVLFNESNETLNKQYTISTSLSDINFTSFGGIIEADLSGTIGGGGGGGGT